MSSPATLLDLLQAGDGQATAVIVPDADLKISYAGLREQVLALAGALAGAGIRRGDRVASALPNGLPTIVTFLAAAIGATAAPMNPAYRQEEFRFYLEDTNARLLLCPPDGGDEARKAAAELGVPVREVDMNAAGVVRLVDHAGQGAVSMPAPDDIALVLHTSGSTGRPKRVPLRHQNIVISARNVAASYALSASDVSLCVMPLFHIHGLVASTLATFLTGGTVVVPGKFNPLGFWRLVRDYGVTWYSAVPTIHHLLLARIGSSERPAGAESLRFIRSCSTALPPDMMLKLEDVFQVPVLEAYGMTEAAHQMASNPLPPRGRVPGSVGPATGTVRISIMDQEGNHLAPGERGEVVIQGANVFHGYEGNPEANAKSFAEGWFRTGDQGYLDESGYLHLTARLKELINRGGEKIAPRAIDEVLLKHPAVAEAVAFGCPHPVWGEEVAAAVVLKNVADEAALLKHCREHLAEFECPKKLYILESIPKTGSGKIQRGVVAASVLKEESTAA